MRPSGILESALYVDDLDAAVAFYGGVLGLERISRAGNRHVFYRCGDGVLLLFNPVETLKPPAPGQSCRCHRMARQDRAICAFVPRAMKSSSCVPILKNMALPLRPIFTGLHMAKTKSAAVRFIFVILPAIRWKSRSHEYGDFPDAQA